MLATHVSLFSGPPGALSPPEMAVQKYLYLKVLFSFFFFSDRFTVPSHLQSLLIVVLVKVKCACEGPGEAEEKQMSQEVWSGPLSIPRGWGTAGPRITL